MEDKNRLRETELSFSHLIGCLFGDSKSSREIKKSHNLTDARSYYLKTIRRIKVAIEETITITDNRHKQLNKR